MRLRDDLDAVILIIEQALIEESSFANAVERAARELRETGFDFTDFTLQHFAKFLEEELHDPS